MAGAGTAVGTLLGAVVGSFAGHPWMGASVGATIGAAVTRETTPEGATAEQAAVAKGQVQKFLAGRPGLTAVGVGKKPNGYVVRVYGTDDLDVDDLPAAFNGTPVLVHRTDPPEALDETGDVVGFFPQSYAQLAGGPGPWTPQRMVLASQYTPDRYGWAMQPPMQKAIGPALAKGGPHGAAYLMMPATTTRWGVEPPGSGYFQQDVLARATEAANVLRQHLVRIRTSQVGEPRRLHNAMGVRFVAPRPQVGRIKLIAAKVARTANLSAVLVHRAEDSWAVYFTDIPSMVQESANEHGQTHTRIAGLEAGTQDAGAAPAPAKKRSKTMHYAAAVLGGAAAGAGAGSFHRASGPVTGAVLGAGVGGLIAALTDEDLPEVAGTSEIEREAVQRLAQGQRSRLLNAALIGPLTVAGAMELKKRPVLATLVAAAGVAAAGSALYDYVEVEDLKAQIKQRGK